MSEVSASSHSTASTLLQAQADTAVAQPAKQGPERYPQAPMLPATAADCPVARRAQLSHLHSQLHLGCSMTGGRCQSVFPVVAAGCCSAAASIAAEGPGDRKGQSPMGPQLESSAAADDRCCAWCHFCRGSPSQGMPMLAGYSQVQQMLQPAQVHNSTGTMGLSVDGHCNAPVSARASGVLPAPAATVISDNRVCACSGRLGCRCARI
jgi:hypothetical protein